MPSWIPVPGSTAGRLVAAGLDLFGSQGFAPVTVAGIADHAGVTTGALYHHFGSKAGLYDVVRGDVEQRVLDRLEGAASALSVATVADIAPVLLVGYDYLVRSGYALLLAEAPVGSSGDGTHTDRVEELLERLLGSGAAPLSALLAAAWRQALTHAGRDADSARRARVALERLITGV